MYRVSFRFLIFFNFILGFNRVLGTFRNQQMEDPYATTTRKPFEVDDFLVDMWNYHNKLRWLHELPPLQLDQRLSENAADWAECIVTNRGTGGSKSNKTVRVEFMRWANNDYTENIFQLQMETKEAEPSLKDIAKLTMYHDIDKPNVSTSELLSVGWFFNCTRIQSGSQKYLQIIYPPTQYLGCGWFFGFDKTLGKNNLVVVCQYVPPMLIVATNKFKHGAQRRVESREPEAYVPKSLNDMDMVLIRKTKHPIVNFEYVLYKFLQSMKYKTPEFGDYFKMFR